MGSSRCQVEHCSQTVSRAGFAFCLTHWKADRAGDVVQCPRCRIRHVKGAHTCVPTTAAPPSPPAPVDEDDAPTGYLSSSKLSRHFGVSAVKVNLILAELGWVERYVKGWVPTDHGNALGANVRELRNGIPYVVWPESILTNAALLASVADQSPAAVSATSPAVPPPLPKPARPDASADFRTTFPPRSARRTATWSARGPRC